MARSDPGHAGGPSLRFPRPSGPGAQARAGGSAGRTTPLASTWASARGPRAGSSPPAALQRPPNDFNAFRTRAALRASLAAMPLLVTITLAVARRQHWIWPRPTAAGSPSQWRPARIKVTPRDPGRALAETSERRSPGPPGTRRLRGPAGGEGRPRRRAASARRSRPRARGLGGPRDQPDPVLVHELSVRSRIRPPALRQSAAGRCEPFSTRLEMRKEAIIDAHRAAAVGLSGGRGAVRSWSRSGCS